MRKVLTSWMLLLSLALATPALAQLDEGKASAAKQAADELLRRAEGSATSGQMPRRTDPAVAKLLDTVFDATALGPATVPIAKITPVGELATNANRVGMTYILAGTGKTDISAKDRETLERVDRNTATFAPEVGQFTDYQLLVTGAMARSALDFAAAATPAVLAQPNVKNGLAQMRAGFGQTITGMLQTLVISGIDDGWKRARLSALEGIADTASRFLGDSEKTGITQMAERVAAAVGPDLRPRVESLGRRIAAPAR